MSQLPTSYNVHEGRLVFQKATLSQELFQNLVSIQISSAFQQIYSSYMFW